MEAQTVSYYEDVLRMFHTGSVNCVKALNKCNSYLKNLYKALGVVGRMQNDPNMKLAFKKLAPQCERNNHLFLYNILKKVTTRARFSSPLFSHKHPWILFSYLHVNFLPLATILWHSLWSQYSLPCIKDTTSDSFIVQALPRFQNCLGVMSVLEVMGDSGRYGRRRGFVFAYVGGGVFVKGWIHQ